MQVAPIVTLVAAIAATVADGDAAAVEGLTHLTTGRAVRNLVITDVDVLREHSAAATETLLRSVLVAGYQDAAHS